jgi:hypothetical protein
MLKSQKLEVTAQEGKVVSKDQVDYKEGLFGKPA